jgi:hypothetical protein
MPHASTLHRQPHHLSTIAIITALLTALLLTLTGAPATATTDPLTSTDPPTTIDSPPWAWGSNALGQLGDGTTDNHSTAVRATGLDGVTVTATAAGWQHSLALLDDGTVRAWGANGDGQLGDGTTTDRSTPVAVSGLTGVTAIAAGDVHSLALLDDGTVRAWGFHGQGQLGDGSTTRSSTPVVVSGLTDVTAIAAGGYHSLAVGAPRAPKPQPTSTTVTCDSAARYFTGHPHEPCTATVTGLGLIQILDVTYSGNVNVGTAKATASFPGTAKHGPSSGGATFAISPWSATGLLPSVFVPAPGTPPAPTADTIWNTAKGGATIPLRFDVHAGEVEKTSTAAVTGFTATKLSACAGAGAETDEVDFVTTGNTSLRYDDTGQQFVQNWKSPTVKSGEDCYRATVTFADRSTLSAFFRLRK